MHQLRFQLLADVYWINPRWREVDWSYRDWVGKEREWWIWGGGWSKGKKQKRRILMTRRKMRKRTKRSKIGYELARVVSERRRASTQMWITNTLGIEYTYKYTNLQGGELGWWAKGERAFAQMSALLSLSLADTHSSLGSWVNYWNMRMSEKSKKISGRNPKDFRKKSKRILQLKPRIG